MKRQSKNQEQPTLINRQLQFANGDKTVTVSVNTAISAFKFVDEVLTHHTTIKQGGKSVKVSVPRFNPCHIDMPRFNRELIKKHKKLAGEVEFNNSMKVW